MDKANTLLLESIQTEIISMMNAGMEQLSMLEIDNALADIGYERDPDSRCSGSAKNMTIGNSYPCVTWGIREQDTKQSAFHYQSRRDVRFKLLQELRKTCFAVVKGKVISI